MLQQIRLAILVSIGLFCLDNVNYVPLPPEPEPIVVEAVKDDTRGKLTERKLWLVHESMAYALHKVAGIQGDQARKIVSLVLLETKKYGVIDHRMVLGLIVVESKGNVQAISSVGARGLMQIMPATGQFIAANFGEKWKGKQSLYEVERNIRYGVWYLNHLQELFPGNERAMVAAYNWGPPNVQSRLARGLPLPEIYPGKVWRAEKQIRKEMYDFYRAHFWRSLDLGQDPPYFRDRPNEPGPRPGGRRILVYDAEGKFLREGPRVQQMSRLLLGRD